MPVTNTFPTRRELRAQKQTAPATITMQNSLNRIATTPSCDCGSATAIADLRREISRVTIERDSLKRLFTNTRPEPLDVNHATVLLTSELAQTRREFAAAIGQNTIYANQLQQVTELLDQQTQQLNSQKDAAAAHEPLRAENQRLKTQLQAALSQVADMADVIADKDTELAEHAAQITEYQTQIEHLENLHHQHANTVEFTAPETQPEQSSHATLFEQSAATIVPPELTTVIDDEGSSVESNVAGFTDEDFLALLRADNSAAPNTPQWEPIITPKTGNQEIPVFVTPKQRRLNPIKPVLIGAAVAITAGAIPIGLPVISTWLTPAVAEETNYPELAYTGETGVEPEIYHYTDTNSANPDIDTPKTSLETYVTTDDTGATPTR